MTTRTFGSRLETQPTVTGRGYRNSTLLQRLAEADAENEQRERWVRMWNDADSKPAQLYEFTRAADRRAAIADDRQRKLVQAGLADGSITVERYLDYRLWQIETDLAHVPTRPAVDDVSFARFGSEAAEGIEAAVRAKCDPTQEAVAHAVGQLQEMLAATQLYTATMQRSAK